MPTRSCSQLSDGDLTRRLHARIAEDRVALADLLALMGEFDSRRLFAPAGFPSMYAYCLGALHLSEGAAYKRITAARKAREFPQILDAVAAGDVHLSAITVLAKHLDAQNITELLAAARHLSKSAVEHLVAVRFPREDVPTSITAVPARPTASKPVELTLDAETIAATPNPPAVAASSETIQLSPGRVSFAPLKPCVAPLAPERYRLQLTISGATREKLRRAQELLRHRLPSGEVAEVIDRALDALLTQLEKQKFAASTKPRAPRAKGSNPRQIPAHVKRAVRERDGGRCTFVSEDGQRCESRDFLEFDHVIPVARGGPSTVENLRQRCRTHNGYEAERMFGAGFMNAKRERTARQANPRPEELEDARAAAAVRGMSDDERAEASARARRAIAQVAAAVALEIPAASPGPASHPACISCASRPRAPCCGGS